jgi:hypothetical protein
MRTKALIIIFFALMLSAATFASEQQRRVEVRVEAHDGHDGEMQSFRFDSDEAGFDLDELQLGESRAYVDAEGNNLYVVRTEEGFDFDLNGRKISMPDFSDHGDFTMMHSDDQVHVLRSVQKIEMVTEDGIGDLDLDIELNFGDMDIHGDHEIYVIKEEVDVTN